MDSEHECVAKVTLQVLSMYAFDDKTGVIVVQSGPNPRNVFSINVHVDWIELEGDNVWED